MKVKWKKIIRKEMIKERNKLTNKDILERSHKIINTLKKLPEFREGQNIMLYTDFNNEVKSDELIKYCLEHKKKTLLPYCKKEGKQIIPTEIKNPVEELITSKMGYKEPKPEYIRPIDIEDIDLIVIPGLAFDKRCYRIGYGAGYYDRFLSKVKRETTLIGVAFDIQIVNTAEIENYDKPLDYVITDKKIILR